MPNKRCVVVTASSGSRGIYGSIAVAGAWGLPKGCAVAYTDKGAGTDYFDLDAKTGARADGTLGTAGVDGDLAFVPTHRPGRAASLSNMRIPKTIPKPIGDATSGRRPNSR